MARVRKAGATDYATANIENVRRIVSERQCLAFVWPEEGEIMAGGSLKLTQEGDYKPCIVDSATANRLIQVYDRVNEVNQEKLARMVSASRLQFLRVIDWIWKL